MSNPQITVTTNPPNIVQVIDGSISVSIPANVSALNGLVGAVGLSGNNGVVVQNSGNTINIGMTNFVSSINNLRGTVALSGDSNLLVQTSGNTLSLSLTNVAKTNVGQTFTAIQSFANDVVLSGNSGNVTLKSVGKDNLVMGSSTSLTSNTSSVGQNIAIGIESLQSSIGGNNNIGLGTQSLNGLTVGSFNIAIGENAGKNYGSEGITLDACNRGIFIGRNTRPLSRSQANQIVIGDSSIGLGANTTVIGNDSTTKTKVQGLLELDDGLDSLNVKNKVIRIEQPQTIVDPFVEGAAGVLCWDDNNLYIKTNQGWKQLALTPVTGNLTGITFDFRLLPADFTNYLTFLRGSSASYLNDAGLTYVQQNIPRVAYYLNSNGSNGDLAGLLVEGSSSNLLPSLETFYDSGSFWQSTSPSSLDVITGSCNGTDLFGENNVLRLTPIGSGNIQHYISSNPDFFPQPLGIVGQSSTISIWAKNYRLERPLYLAIQMVNQACTITCDLAENKFDIDARFAAIPTPVGKITSYPDDWKKITFTYTNKEAFSNSIRIYVTNNFTNYSVGFNAAGYEGTGILVADIQLENQTTDSSYIKTVGSSVTRSPDRLFMDGASFSSWFSVTSGTFLTLVDNSLQENTSHTQGNVRTLFSINYAPGSTSGFAVERVMGMCGYRFISHNNGISYNFGSDINLNTVKNSIIALSYFNFSDSIMGVCASINGSNTEGITIDRTQFGICGACFFSIGYKGASTAAAGLNFYNGVIKKITYLNGAALDLKSLSIYQE